MMYRSRTLMNGLGYAWKALERCFPTNVTEKISWMTFCADKMVNTVSSLAAAISVHRLACKTLRFENQGGRAVSGFPRILESPWIFSPVFKAWKYLKTGLVGAWKFLNLSYWVLESPEIFLPCNKYCNPWTQLLLEWWAFSEWNIVKKWVLVRSNLNIIKKCQVTVDLMIAGLLVTSMRIGLVGQRTYARRDAHFAY